MRAGGRVLSDRGAPLQTHTHADGCGRTRMRCESYVPMGSAGRQSERLGKCHSWGGRRTASRGCEVMEFLLECARRLDDGETTGSVLKDVSLRYTTVRCLNVKMSRIRRLCTPTPEFVERCNGDVMLLSGKTRAPLDFPPRYPPNVLAFKLSRADAKTCKRLHTTSTVEKNKKMKRVDGRRILRVCREEVDEVIVGRRAPGPNLILAIMLLTGRRTCEIVNGESLFRVGGEYSLEFTGQAKKRCRARGYVVPCLHPTGAIIRAISRLREWTAPPVVREGLTLNQSVSQKYQSWLRRSMLKHDVLAQAGKVHALRGLYARMAYRLFDWEDDFSEAYVVMHILGHSDITESLVYTACHLGAGFHEEPGLGTFRNLWDDGTGE